MPRWQSSASDDAAYDSVQFRELMFKVEPVFKHEDGAAWTGRVATSAKSEETVVKLAVQLNDRLLNQQAALLTKLDRAMASCSSHDEHRYCR
ncbi:hypothetical protein [Candidatus Poriferisodalis multihospitum]|uniref:hypothetical protein n=1 Tax=Candidatus Poriferisodalis multihospitum TaxID=2983191 RepID=UPI001382D387|nr:hypothetical protein [Candidatus Poriferisodalis multihospitum]MYI29730.1 hypothetical protein [Acidimicrobiales bacterium]